MSTPYTPPAGFATGAPQQIGSRFYFLEYQADVEAFGITVRLNRSDSARWGSVETLHTETVVAQGFVNPSQWDPA